MHNTHHLKHAYHLVSGSNAPGGFAQLAFPDDDLNELIKVAKHYLVKPEMLSPYELEDAVNQAADMASHFFDDHLGTEDRECKSKKRRDILMQSALAKDGTTLFFRKGNKVYGYNRVLAVSENQWQSYLETYTPSESGFEASNDIDCLETGKGRIYLQATVFPTLPEVHKKDKYVLQTFARMYQIAGILQHVDIDRAVSNANGIRINFTAFHPHTDRWASDLGACVIGQNPNRMNIYGVNVSPSESSNTFGAAIYKRLILKKSPLNLVCGV